MYLSLKKRNILCLITGVISLIIGIGLLFPIPSIMEKLCTSVSMLFNLIVVFILIKSKQEHGDEMYTRIILEATYKSFQNLIYAGFILGLTLSVAMRTFHYTLKYPLAIGHIIFGVGYTSYFYLLMKYEKKGLC